MEIGLRRAFAEMNYKTLPVQRITLDYFTLGSMPPKLGGIRVVNNTREQVREGLGALGLGFGVQSLGLGFRFTLPKQLIHDPSPHPLALQYTIDVILKFAGENPEPKP